METKRCPRCHKLLRADAQSCSRCGTLFSAKQVKKQAVSKSDSDLLLSQPTNPLASPHQAGHYSGLHPEDQPFQSSFFLRIQRPDAPEQVLENEDTRPASDSGPGEPEQVEIQLAREDKTPVQQISELAELPTYYPQKRTALPETPLPLNLRPSAQRARLAPALIGLALIFFLVATSLLVFLLLGRSSVVQARAQITALPGELRTGDTLLLTGKGFHTHSQIIVTRDGQTVLVDTKGRPVQAVTDSQGNFQVRVPIMSSWRIGSHLLQATDKAHLSASTSITIQATVAGPPRLQLGMAHLDLGAGNPGTQVQKTVMLINLGGGEIIWQAKSNVAWLTLNPANGTFAGHAIAVVSINRTNLVPQAYLGQILFTSQQGGSQILYVSMAVNTIPARLVLSSTALSFSGTPQKNPASQTIIIQNAGGQTLNWSAGSSISSGFNWLSITPSSGRLDAGTSAILTISVSTIQMAQGSYQGAFSFSDENGPTQQVAVTLSISSPPTATNAASPTATLPTVPALHVTPQSLNFAANQGIDPTPQSFIIANTGTAPLNWAIQGDADAQTYLDISALNGGLAPGQSITITVSPVPGNASGTINASLTILDSDPGTKVRSQQVTIALVIADQPVITVITGDMQFYHDSISNDSSQILMFSNTGNLPLNWSLEESPSVPWLSFSVTSGTLAANSDTAYITVECNSTNIQPQTYTVTLIIQDTDNATVVIPQAVTVTLLVSN